MEVLAFSLWCGDYHSFMLIVYHFRFYLYNYNHPMQIHPKMNPFLETPDLGSA
jgi:hypothetical protein